MSVGHNKGQNLPFDEGVEYREELLARSIKAVRKAQYMLDAYKALSVCLLAETQYDNQMPDFVEDIVLHEFHDHPEDFEPYNVVDAAVEMADMLMGYESCNDEESFEHALIKKGDFATLEPEQLWIFYVPNVLFQSMELEMDGRIPEDLDPTCPYIFTTYNKQFSNNVIETQIDIAEYTTNFLEPAVNAMIEFLDSRIGLGANVKPHFFKEVIKLAKKDGHDVSRPLKTGLEFSWFDMYWDAVLIEEDKLARAVNDNSASFDLPPGTILQ